MASTPLITNCYPIDDIELCFHPCTKEIKDESGFVIAYEPLEASKVTEYKKGSNFSSIKFKDETIAHVNKCAVEELKSVMICEWLNVSPYRQKIIVDEENQKLLQKLTKARQYFEAEHIIYFPPVLETDHMGFYKIPSYQICVEFQDSDETEYIKNGRLKILRLCWYTIKNPNINGLEGVIKEFARKINFQDNFIYIDQEF